MAMEWDEGMTVVEEKLRLGGNPQGLEKSAALGGELAKLNHPAQPDMDWPRVERLCVALFREHGMELQSVTAFALARAYLHGLQGLEEGLGLTRRLLVGDWERLWPLTPAVRMEMLAWLFTQVRPWLRGVSLSDADVPVLLRLEESLKALADLLQQRQQMALAPLEALRIQVQGLLRLLSGDGHATSRTVTTSPAEAKTGLPAPAEPIEERQMVHRRSGDAPSVVVLTLDREPVATERSGRKLWPWLLVLGALLVLTGLLAWVLSQGRQAARVVAPTQAVSPQPLRLDGQLLFPPGKAELRPDSDKVLVRSLIDIKAQPGWLIIITGHSDSTGDARHNIELSRSRAAAVRDWMQRMGDIPDDCFEVRGAGDSQPVASDETEQGRNANRRVEIILTPDGGACRNDKSHPDA